MRENDLSYIIRGSIFEVYNTLGPGLLESVYQQTLAYELAEQQLDVRTEVPVPVVYKDQNMDMGFRIDVLVNKKVLIELKSVEQLHDVHHKQVLTYLKLTNLKLGLLVNFNSENISKAIFCKVNGL
ncbi:MAG: GxxExxY protein [Balneolaceae bacterium]|nr:GxxExxY protein [Balneolaceae bacterium]